MALTVAELLEPKAGSDDPAIIEGSTGRVTTWAEVARQADTWQDWGPRGPVGLALADPLAMASNFMAALAAGVLVAPLDPAAPRRELETRIDELGLQAVVTDHRGEVKVEWSRRDGQELRPPGQPAVLMSSSGTTGEPKIIPLTEQQLLATGSGVAEHLGLGPDQRGYSPLPLFHINGLVVGVLSALIADASIVVERQFSRRSFWETVRNREVTWLNLVPAILAILAVEPLPGAEPGWHGSGRVRLARSASAPLPGPVRERFETLTGIPVIETYGMTEAASQITANPIGDVRPGSVGRAVGVEIQVVDSEGSPAATGEVGQVHLRGDRVTPVYWVAEGSSGWGVRPALNSEGWLPTGDVGRMDADGYLYLTGRQGDAINRGGEKLHPREIEEVLLTDSRVTAAVVVGRPHPTVGEEPVAYVLAADPELDLSRLAADLDELCCRSLSRHKRPAQIYPTRSLPSGPTGKIRRAAVRAMALATAESAKTPTSQ